MGYGICGNDRIGPIAEPLKDNSVVIGGDLCLGNFLPPDKLNELQEELII